LSIHGTATQTGGRFEAVLPYIGDESSAHIRDASRTSTVERLLEFHRAEGRLARDRREPGRRFGALERRGRPVAEFREKPAGEAGVNGVLSLAAHRRTTSTATQDRFRAGAARRLAPRITMSAYGHAGFCAMDTLREKGQLEGLAAGEHRGRSGSEFWRGRRPPHGIGIQGKLAGAPARRARRRRGGLRERRPTSRRCYEMVGTVTRTSMRSR